MTTATPEYSQLQLFRKSLPAKPYTTDELGMLVIRPLETAIKNRYIQPNTPHDLRWLVYDVDRETAHYDWQDRHCPPPNFTAMNRENGHCHLFYGLEVPVWRQYGHKDAAFRYASAIDVALTTALDADPGYAKLISKNPLRQDAWEVNSYQNYSYDLPLLADYLDLIPFEDRRRNLPGIGLGRNCTLFDRTRMWSYRNIRREWLGEEFWMYSVGHVATAYNDFAHPLPFTEVRATSKSVGHWVWKHMSPIGFRAWADNRRAKSMAVRQGKAIELIKKIQTLAAENPEATQRELAALADCSLGSVNKALRATI